ncbi:hypothetical protein A3K82_02160 [Candidatus Pacearchaeota archaeon RBG_19FT_COMBO_34_9]|nr:MAG: hypothetical protein A3K82_02160 [Candidatus Pacearchaeota archaeon RBG_19FT_COMBO_34_9]OGJ16088.1 MAG: hypothetical protein A3K74_02540 [Candidatus Pacearchaeota archaeon RBG_13_33_26]
MAKRGAKIYRVNLSGELKEMSPSQFKFLEQKEEHQSRRIKRIFYILLDAIILVSFLLSLYFAYFQDYIKTIIFLITGSLLLIFFILKKAFRKKEVKR